MMGWLRVGFSLASLFLLGLVALTGCDQSTKSREIASVSDEPSPHFRNVDTKTSYVGDAACTTCHVRETSAYRQHAMASSFHRWTRATRIETPLDTPLFHRPTGFHYSVVDSGGHLHQVEFLIGPLGKRLHELRRRVDYVMGSGYVALTYFTEENGRLFQLPLTWYRQFGWDFSPGYQINNARFDRWMPDRCIACHSSYPQPLPFLEGKYAEVRPGIGCERCHGPGALHVTERSARVPRDSGYDATIVNPARLPLERRLDTCEQCHVHTPVSVLREGRTDFSYVPSTPLRDQIAFFKISGSIDIVSHADRLRQSACFIATRATSRPLECATCHNPHVPAADSVVRNQSCQSCHVSAVLQQRLARSTSLSDHKPTSDCVTCHMPKVQVRPVLHGTFTDHWIRVVKPESPQTTAGRKSDSPIEAYFARDERGPEAKIYQGMGEIVYATRATDSRVLARAASALNDALEKDTSHHEARFLLGVAYEQLGKNDEAVRALGQSIRGDSARPDRLRALAQAYERAGRSPAEIEQLYQRALALQPALAWIRADYADFLHAQGRRADAERAYRAAVAEQPNLAVAWFNLGTLLAEDDRSRETSDAFQQAVRLDPSLAQALSPLLEIRTSGNVVSDVRTLPPPLVTMPVRDRGPRAVQLTATAEGTRGVVRFLNVPPRGVVQILKPDGTLIRTLPTSDEWSLVWDLMTDRGAPIAGGLYRARVQARDASGRALTQFLYFGVVRRRGE
jgi:tetratricopeptide (TPR) repeat protein